MDGKHKISSGDVTKGGSGWLGALFGGISINKKYYLLIGQGAAVASIVLGVMVIIGWYTRSEGLIQISSQFAPMQYNTALGFILSGLGLLGLTLDKVVLARVFGGLVALLGLVTMSQYVFGFNFGLDNFFMDHYITTKTSNIGRMGPATTVSFSLFGVALIAHSYRKFLGAISLGGEFIGMSVVAMAGLGYLSYMVKVDVNASWQDLTSMAIHTTTGFLILGLGFLFTVWSEEREKIATVPLWVPVILSFIVLVGDLSSPLGIAAGVAYVPLVFCALWFKGRYVPYSFAMLATVLVVLGYLASPDAGAVAERVLINRGLSMLAIWITAFAIFAQKRTEINLAFSEKELENRAKFQESITNTMVDGLIVIDEIGTIISVNKAGLKMFGYKVDEMIGNNIKMLMQGDTRKEHDGYLKRYHETQDRVIVGIGPREVTGFTKDGDRLDLELAVDASKLEGKDIFVGSLRDLTEKKRILEESNVELEKFAYVASHDLRAPLRAIDNLSEWIEEDLKDLMKPETKKNMDLLRGRVKRLESLLDDILQYSRAGRSVEKTMRVDVGEAFENVKSFLNIPKGFDVKARGKMPKVLAPKGAFDQIFNNLMTNALKHHDKKTGLIVVSVRELEEKWEFSVADDGPGIPHEFQEKIFGMFQKLEGRDKAEGSGMGLAIIKKLVTTHGGKVWVKSSGKRRGTTFMFTWPKIDPDAVVNE